MTVDSPATSNETRRRSDQGGARRVASEAVQRGGLLFVWLALAVVFSVMSPHIFATQGTLKTIFGTQETLILLALSLLPLLIVGELDLSVAANLGLSATLCAVLNGQDGVNIVVAVLIALAAACLVGVINGILIVYTGVSSLIVTLGMGALLDGIAVGISHSITVGGVSKGLTKVVSSQLGGLPYSFYFLIAIAALLWYVFEMTPTGRNMVFIGKNAEVARLAGVRVARIRFLSAVSTALLAGVAGIIYIGTIGAIEPSSADSYLLPAYAAAFLGAVCIRPGRFNSWGTLVAGFFLITGITGIEELGYGGYTANIFYGLALIIGVVASTFAQKLRALADWRSIRPTDDVRPPVEDQELVGTEVPL